MKLRVFQSKDGDCILLTGKDGKMVLADGGRSASYKAHVGAELEKLKSNEDDFEAVYISHIDADHVEGIERMLGDLIEWGRFDFRKSKPDDVEPEPPDVPRPIRPKKFWHNSFHEQADDNKGEIADLLAASATMLSALPATASAANWSVAREHEHLATSMKQAFNISSRIGKNLLNIELNPEFDKKLMFLSDTGPEVINVGKMNWHIIGPTETHLKKLRDKWNKWVESEKGGKAIGKVKKKAAEDQAELGNSANAASELTNLRALEAKALAETFANNDFALSGKKGGARNGVTTPNLASLMFLVEEGTGSKRRTVLMTGDGHWKDIIEGLEEREFFDTDGNLHVDVLKIPHHGATANMDAEFLKRVTADHYLFCGISSSHHNPEKDVVKQVLDSRLVGTKKSSHAKVDDKFKLWFSGDSKNPDLTENSQKHIKSIEEAVAARKDPARFDTFFLAGGPSFEIPL